ncbi:MAG: HEPN domain-containing protein [Candidatus Aminicenantes bacterium]|nr:HEPN domain-containing protein [Candidatus Aminicenantes bacterium]NIM83246.1 HEPN domain-containing protein [Candidatus Aminicenantes bacterium]NIN22617.1 HEPN domain-containing protein [Candidatus Aminicenantes bacterium]NIN46376.1 HEPN domain-containing protein [Candidatus Aminicenantes bacterium]NIN89226.1 HEPN domain-containing protein [Candidatus Aminicenantes bacterium]
MKNEIESVIDKSKRSIKSAKREYKAGDYDYACSRAYYAAFYLLEGVLLLDNKRFTKHSAVISFFNKDYVKTNVFPVEFSKHIKYLLKRREIGDYSFSIRVSQEEAQNCISKAEEIIKVISDYLKKKSTEAHEIEEPETRD